MTYLAQAGFDVFAMEPDRLRSLPRPAWMIRASVHRSAAGATHSKSSRRHLSAELRVQMAHPVGLDEIDTVVDYLVSLVAWTR